MYNGGMNENYNTPNSSCCGRKINYAPENKCNYKDECETEYPCSKLACIKERQPDCKAKAVIPSITVDSVEGITDLANCLVHVNDINTTFYIDDKHRIMITWAGPVNIPGYDMETNPERFRDQIITDTEAGLAVIYDAKGVGYTFGIEQGLDVTEAVNNKIDEMAEDGSLAEIIVQYIGDDITWTFDTVADMRLATNLVAGSYAQTLGYSTPGDSGGAYYMIRTATGSDVDNGGNIIILDDGKVAELLVLDRSITTKQFGCVGDGTTNDTIKFQNALDYIKNNYSDGCELKIVGNCLVNPTLQLKGTSSNKLANITITSIDGGNSAYINVPSLSNGITFQYDYSSSKVYGLDLDYINGVILKNIFIKSNESVPNGDIPLNLISGVRLLNCNNTRVEYCNFNNLFKGLYTYGSGLFYIEKNNFSLCNVGCWLQEDGDSTLVGNYFNTNGWNIRNDDGTIKPKYSGMSSGDIFGMGLWCGGVGSTNIIGGKCEWNDTGFYLETTQGFTITGVNFDYNVRTHIGICTTYTTPMNTAMSILNNRFVSGGWTDSGTYLAGASICLWKVYGITITGNTFMCGEKNYDNMFDGVSTYYGPKLGFIRCVNAYNTCVVSNTFTTNKQSVVGFNSNITFGNNFDSNTYDSSTSLILKSNRQLFLNQDTLPSFTSGDFETGDLIRKKTDITDGWKCTDSGSYGSISGLTGTVIDSETTVGSVSIPTDKTVIELGGTLSSLIHPGCYINIAGVTGTKRIIDIIQYKNPTRVFCRVDSACDVAVSGGAITLHNPTFTSI